MKPYYQDEAVTIYHGDCREMTDLLDDVAIVITDPPYGIDHPTNYKTRGRGKLANCHDFPPVYGDTEKFDPSLWIDIPCCLWGANYFADRLPISSGWLVWDKLRPDTLDQATCELAWTNFVKGVRRFQWLWNGMMKAEQGKLVHPTQKPVVLMKWIMTLKWTPIGTVLDPYMGSGSTLRAAKDLGRRAIGIEIEECYCEIAAKRMSQMVMEFEGGE